MITSLEHLLAACILAFCFSHGFARLAAHEVSQISEGRDRPGLSLASLVPAVTASLFLMVSGWDGGLDIRLAYAALIIPLTSMAIIDGQTAWAPNSLSLPLLALTGFILGSGTVSVALAGAAALPLIYIAAQHAFATLARFMPRMPPPADIMAFGLGPALLGFGLPLAVALLLAFLALLIFRIFPGLQAQNAPESAREDLSYTEEMGPAIPLLSILFPSYMVGLFVLHWGTF